MATATEGEFLTVSRASVNGHFEREDWTFFRSIRTISQYSGVAPELLRRLVAKELADNALDAAGSCRVGTLPGGVFYVEDDGPGIGGGPEEVARIFSFRRPMVSSKLIRLPTRGAQGMGLRVVAGAVFASRGSLRVITRGQALDLVPQEAGNTVVEKVKECQGHRGTRIEVRLGDGAPQDSHCLEWAGWAIKAAGPGPVYVGKASPWWYDSDAAFELFKAAGQRTVAEVMREFEGNGHLKIPKPLFGRVASSLAHEDVEHLLDLAREHCEQLKPERLALLGKGLDGHHAKEHGVLDLKPGRGTLHARLPYTAEAWVKPSGYDCITVLVNRSPVTREMTTQRDQERAHVGIFGCNLSHGFKVGQKAVDIVINVQIPYMPIVSTGKEPDLKRFLDSILQVIERAAEKCQRANPSKKHRSRILPSLKRGRPSDADKEQYARDLRAFADLLKEIDSTVDFRVSSRGWCYVLENRGDVTKGEFDRVQDLINECRKAGDLPIDFTVEDEARAAACVEELHSVGPKQYAADQIGTAVKGWESYTPISFWAYQPIFIQMVVEKIDLKQLFLPVCAKYHIPLLNSRGWSDLNMRAGLMRRFREHEIKGRRPVLLVCGDHDPVGLQIPNKLPEHLGELSRAVGWSPENLIIDRFGLNADFIKEHNLTWIDKLITGSGKDLGDPEHRQHNAESVQEYIRMYGKRKVEANALVVRPEAGRRLCQAAIEKYLDLDAIAAYEAALAEQRQKVREATPSALSLALKELRAGQ
jgi:hypothetical protein